MSVKDALLLKQIESKDGKAFEMFYRRYSSLLYKWAYNRIGKDDHVEDLLQDFWSNLWIDPTKIKTDENGNAKKFLLHFFTYRVLDYIRKNMNHQLLTNYEDGMENLSRSMLYSHIIEEIEAKELTLLIDQIIDTLPEITQLVFNLRWKENRSPQETAVLLEIDEKAVYNRMHTALNIIRKQVLEMIKNDQNPTTIQSVNALVLLLNLLE